MTDETSDPESSPLDALGAIAVQDVPVAPGLDHVELYTLEGLLTVLWHGRDRGADAVVMVGGAMGGLLGPADGLYQDLGTAFAANGITTLRVSYRVPNDLGRCVHDTIAAAELAARNGAERFVFVGHSFGGAVALRAAIALGPLTAGVVTLATQSAGCEDGDRLGDVPMLLYHGDRDELLPAMASEVVASLTGGELVHLEETGHLLREAGERLRTDLGEWIPARLREHVIPPLEP